MKDLPISFLDQQNKFKGKPFPLVLDGSAISDCMEWIKANSMQLKDELSKNGAILFRNFLKGNSPQKFYEFTSEGLQVKALPYVGGAAPRNTVYKGIQ